MNENIIMKADSSESKGRLFELLIKIANMDENDCLSPTELAHELGVSRKTIYSYINILSLYFPIFLQGGLRRSGDIIIKSIKFDQKELLAIMSLIEMVDEKKDYPYKKEVMSIKKKIVKPEGDYKLEDMLSKIEMHFDCYFSIDSDIFDNLQQAMEKQEVIEMDYYSPVRDKVETREFSPYAAFFRKNAWYTVGFCHKNNEIRTFNVSRIKKIKILTNKDYEIPEDFYVKSYLENTWEVIRGKDEKINIKVKFTGHGANVVKTMKRHPSQEIEELQDGSIIYSVTLDDWEEFSYWIAGYGAFAEVLEPPDLRDWMITQAKEVLRVYGEGL